MTSGMAGDPGHRKQDPKTSMINTFKSHPSWKKQGLALGAWLVLLWASVLPATLSAASPQVGQSATVPAETVQAVMDSDGLRLFERGRTVLLIEEVRLDFFKPSRWRLEQEGGRQALVLEFDGIEDEYRNAAKGDVTGGGRRAVLFIEAGQGQWRLYSEEQRPWFSDIEIVLKDSGQAYYGLTEVLAPDNQKNMNLAGKVIALDYQGEAHRYLANYASAFSPFFYSTSGYASFVNSRSEGQYQFSVNGKTHIRHRAYGFDWYVFTGSQLDDIHRRYFAVIGAPKKIPDWALGPVLWRDHNRGGASEVLSDLTEFTKRKIPVTAMFVDRPYSDGAEGWSQMNFGPGFDSPEKWIKTIRDDFDVRFMSWVAPMVFGDPNFPGRFPGAMGYIDLSNPQAVNEFQGRLAKFQHRYGVQGHKMDRADEDFPVHESWSIRIRPELRRGTFMALYAQTVDQSLRKQFGSDHFNFARAAVHGTQQHLSAIWGGDVRSNWGGLRTNIANALRASFIGFPNWGTDIGGYQGDTGLIPEDLYLRWTQFAVWTGFFGMKLDGAGGFGKDRLPWRYSEKFQDRYRAAFDLRMRLIPYLRTQLNQSATLGTLMKPLAGAYPHDIRTHGLWDQYLFGQDFLVAPVVDSKAQTRSIFLPGGTWFDFHDHSMVRGGDFKSVPIVEDRIPVFVRDGAIVVLGAPAVGNRRNWTKADSAALEIQVYVGAPVDRTISFVDTDGIKPIYVQQRGAQLDVRAPALSANGHIRVITPLGSRLIAFTQGQPIRLSIPLPAK